MTRRVVYGIGLWLSVAATVMTIAAIVEPRWITYQVKTPSGQQYRYQYGLHERCSTRTGECESYPKPKDCHGENQRFCNMWRSVGFMMSFSVVVQLATLLAYAVCIMGGKQKRDGGWRIITGLLAVVFVVECASMAIMVTLFDKEDRFIPGWKLDASWILCTVSWIVTLFVAIGMSVAGLFLPEEGGYELIPNIVQGS